MEEGSVEDDSLIFVWLSRLEVVGGVVARLLDRAFLSHTFIERSSKRLALITDRGFCVHSTRAADGEAAFMSENKLRNSK